MNVLKNLFSAVDLRLTTLTNGLQRIAAMFGVALWLTTALIPMSAQAALISTDTNWVDSGKKFSFNGATYEIGTYTIDDLHWYRPDYWTAVIQSQPWYGSEASAWLGAYAWTSSTIASNVALASFGSTVEEGWDVMSQVQLGGYIGAGFVGEFNDVFNEYWSSEDGSSFTYEWWETLNVKSWSPSICVDEPFPFQTLNATAYVTPDCSQLSFSWYRDNYDYNTYPYKFTFVGVHEVPAPATNVTTVPEPGTIVLFGLALTGLAVARRRKI